METHSYPFIASLFNSVSMNSSSDYLKYSFIWCNWYLDKSYVLTSLEFYISVVRYWTSHLGQNVNAKNSDLKSINNFKIYCTILHTKPSSSLGVVWYSFEISIKCQPKSARASCVYMSAILCQQRDEIKTAIFHIYIDFSFIIQKREVIGRLTEHSFVNLH